MMLRFSLKLIAKNMFDFCQQLIAKYNPKARLGNSALFLKFKKKKDGWES